MQPPPPPRVSLVLVEKGSQDEGIAKRAESYLNRADPHRMVEFDDRYPLHWVRVYGLVNDAIVSHAQLNVRRTGAGHIDSVYVTPEYSRQRLCGRMLDALIDWSVRHGVTRVTLFNAGRLPGFLCYVRAFIRKGWRALGITHDMESERVEHREFTSAELQAVSRGVDNVDRLRLAESMNMLRNDELVFSLGRTPQDQDQVVSEGGGAGAPRVTFEGRTYLVRRRGDGMRAIRVRGRLVALSDIWGRYRRVHPLRPSCTPGEA